MIPDAYFRTLGAKDATEFHCQASSADRLAGEGTIGPKDTLDTPRSGPAEMKAFTRKGTLLFWSRGTPGGSVRWCIDKLVAITLLFVLPIFVRGKI